MVTVNVEAAIHNQSYVETNSFLHTKEDVSIVSEDIHADSYFEWTKYIITLMMMDDADKYENTCHWAQWESQAAG